MSSQPSSSSSSSSSLLAAMAPKSSLPPSSTASSASSASSSASKKRKSSKRVPMADAERYPARPTPDASQMRPSGPEEEQQEQRMRFQQALDADFVRREMVAKLGQRVRLSSAKLPTFRERGEERVGALDGPVAFSSCSVELMLALLRSINTSHSRVLTGGAARRMKRAKQKEDGEEGEDEDDEEEAVPENEDDDDEDDDDDDNDYSMNYHDDDGHEETTAFGDDRDTALL